ncbi:MAG: adenosine kinase [Rhodomicrobium sp.]|nr:MAG: adenosine kinase [Rhodomicrobium sp.]
MSDHDVIGIGNAIVDIIARCDDDVLTKLNLPKGNMQLISAEEADRLYNGMGPAVEISGGSAANTCAGIAALGGKSSFIGSVKDDQFGKVFHHDLNAIGVTFNTGFATGDTPTARCLVFVTPDGERTMNTYLGACAELGPEDLDEDMIRGAKISYLEGYLFDPPRAKEAFMKTAAIAKQAGNRVALTLSDAFCVERHREDFLNFIRRDVDILFANEDEIKALYQVDQFEDAADNARHDVELAALTQGIDGSFIIHGNAATAVPSFRVESVMDTTGAGDLFAAGFLYGFTQGKSLDICGSLGALAAAEVISHIGARPEANLIEISKANNLL